MKLRAIKKVYQMAAILLLLTALACQQNEAMKLNRLPLLPQAVRAEVAGAEKEQFNFAVINALNMLRNNYRIAETEIYSLPAETTAHSIAQFYDENLKKSGFARKSSLPDDSAPIQTIIWEQSGLLDSNVVAVSLIKIENIESQNFLLVGVGSKK